MGVLQRVLRARGNRAALKDLGRRILNLEIVHEHAKAKCNNLNFVDDVCVYLRFEIALREDLDLPVSSCSMHFPSYMKVTEDEIKAAKEEALGVSEAAFKRWLESWDEWQRQLRLEAVEEISWENLPVFDSKKKGWRKSWRKSLRNLMQTKVKDAVIVNGNRCSFADFAKHWVGTGCDFENHPFDISNLYRV